MHKLEMKTKHKARKKGKRSSKPNQQITFSSHHHLQKKKKTPFLLNASRPNPTGKPPSPVTIIAKKKKKKKTPFLLHRRPAKPN
jgi:hypothetical protein